MNLDAARRALADAVIAAGQPCLPYPPDTIFPPVAFVDTIEIGYDGQPAYTLAPTTATVVACEQRHDKQGATTTLESRIGPTITALRDIPGLRVTRIASGQFAVGNEELPTVVYTVTFQLSEES